MTERYWTDQIAMIESMPLKDALVTIRSYEKRGIRISYYTEQLLGGGEKLFVTEIEYMGGQSAEAQH